MPSNCEVLENEIAHILARLALRLVGFPKQTEATREQPAPSRQPTYLKEWDA